MKVKFIKSPTGLFNLAYSVGQSTNLENGLAKKCIDAGVAIEIKSAKKPNK